MKGEQKMNRQEVILFLEQSGYKSYPIPRTSSEGIVWSGSKRLPEGTVLCDCNENKISWHVHVSDWFIPNDAYNREFKSIEIEIVAEKNDQWYSLKCYGIQFDQIDSQLKIAEGSLLRAWEACAKS